MLSLIYKILFLPLKIAKIVQSNSKYYEHQYTSNTMDHESNLIVGCLEESHMGSKLGFTSWVAQVHFRNNSEWAHHICNICYSHIISYKVIMTQVFNDLKQTEKGQVGTIF